MPFCFSSLTKVWRNRKMWTQCGVTVVFIYSRSEGNSWVGSDLVSYTLRGRGKREKTKYMLYCLTKIAVTDSPKQDHLNTWMQVGRMVCTLLLPSAESMFSEIWIRTKTNPYCILNSEPTSALACKKQRQPLYLGPGSTQAQTWHYPTHTHNQDADAKDAAVSQWHNYADKRATLTLTGWVGCGAGLSGGEVGGTRQAAELVGQGLELTHGTQLAACRTGVGARPCWAPHWLMRECRI